MENDSLFPWGVGWELGAGSWEENDREGGDGKKKIHFMQMISDCRSDGVFHRKQWQGHSLKNLVDASRLKIVPFEKKNIEQKHNEHM